MSSYTDIKFSCDLLQNGKVNITYSGDLFKRNSDSVTIVYGFGDEWNHTTEKLMEKTEDGFTAEINLLNYNKFNFCFRNSNYEWDNNNYQNYTSPISEEPQIEEKFIINENIVNEILTDLFEKDISKLNNTILKTVDENEIVTKEDVSTNPEVNKNENIEFSVEVEKDEPVAIEDSIVNSVEESELNNDIENIFNDIYNEENVNEINDVIPDNKQELLTNILSENQTETGKIAEFDMDNLIDEILSPIVKSSTFEEENVSSIENFKQQLENNNLENNEDTISENIVTENNINFENIIKSNIDTNTVNNASKDINKEENIVEISESELDKELDNSIDNLINNLYYNAQNEAQKLENKTTNIENVQTVQETEEKVNEIEVNTDEANVEVNVNDEESNVENDIELDTEAPLIDVLNTDETEKNQETALIEIDTQDDFLVSPRSLGKFYMFKKKVKLAFYKLFVAIPKILSSAFDEGKANNK